MDHLEIFTALSNKSRLQILHWLKEPELNFPDQKLYGFASGVCVGQIRLKIGLVHMAIWSTISFGTGPISLLISKMDKPCRHATASRSK
jgi:ArsR family transcriptional regulator